jgi:hypothetical protein
MAHTLKHAKTAVVKGVPDFLNHTYETVNHVIAPCHVAMHDGWYNLCGLPHKKGYGQPTVSIY